MKYIQKKIYVHPFKTKRKLKNCILDPKRHKNGKVINAFLKILISEIDPSGNFDIMKSDFMNQAMMIYTNRKNEIDTLARTFHNLNGVDGNGKNYPKNKMSPKPLKKFSGGMGNINGYSKMNQKSREANSRFKFTSMSIKTKGIIPANISNVNRSINKNLHATTSHNASYTNSHKYKNYRKGNRFKKNRSSHNYDLAKSLQRSKLGSSYQNNESSYDQSIDSSNDRSMKSQSINLQDLSNDGFGKSRSIDHDQTKTREFSTRNINQQYKPFSPAKGPSASVNMKTDKISSFGISQMLLDDLRSNKDDEHELSAKKKTIEKNMPKNIITQPMTKRKRKKSSCSVASNDVYRNEDSRHFSHQQNKPIYIANLLSGNPASSRLVEEEKICASLEESKSPSPTKPGAVGVPKKIQKSPSETHERNINSIFSHVPHGGALERLNNEERLNFLSEANLSKIDSSANCRQEKSVDLDFRSGAMLDRNSADFITNRVIHNNQLSKYLTKFIGNKDYRTTEERELDKCTFKPKFVNKKKFKNVKGKVSGAIKEKDHKSRERDIALFSASENIRGAIQSSQSVSRGLSADGRFNNSLSMSDGGFLFRTDDDEASTISVLNEMRSVPTIYSNKNVAGLGGILQFGYSHKFHAEKHYKNIIKPTVKSINKANTTFYGSCGRALSLSINQADTSNVFKAKILTPIKSSNGLKTQRLFTNNLASKAKEVAHAHESPNKGELTNFSSEELEKIKKIHEIHFKVKRA
ncbi:unnamed protein product [Moneuplotes crassus]|uniref:Uncharacterized protein n=1 Tax=Euplotes crassus TaxID=5936 RepID=A0AAD1XV10_EUPCR|nr:unnamed protein product [Moneuplotes crassus]